MLKGSSMKAVEVWAYISPDGRILADTTFKDENHVWQVALGWPTAEEIEKFKEQGCRVEKIKILVEG